MHRFTMQQCLAESSHTCVSSYSVSSWRGASCHIVALLKFRRVEFGGIDGVTGDMLAGGGRLTLSFVILLSIIANAYVGICAELLRLHVCLSPRYNTINVGIFACVRTHACSLYVAKCHPHSVVRTREYRPRMLTQRIRIMYSPTLFPSCFIRSWIQ